MKNMLEEIEAMCNNQSEIWQQYSKEYEDKINRYLEEEDRSGLIELLEDSDFNEKFKAHTDMAYMILAGQIYQEEKKDGKGHTIFDGKKNVQEVENYIRRLKFLLWHVEFDTEAGAGDQLLSFLQQEQVSTELLKYMVHTVGMQKMYLLESLAELFLNRNMFGMSFAMLNYADELCPGQEDVLCTMADLCLQAGKKEEAVRCLDRVENPSHITAAFRKLCG